MGTSGRSRTSPRICCQILLLASAICLAAPSAENSDQATPVYPGDLLNLANWKLTLPIGSSEDPTEISGSALKTYTNPNYFHLNESRTGVVFAAHCGGVTTSGSNYPRSELREMFGWTKASWSTTSGTHAMYIKQAITHTPVKKPEVVAGQIHGSSDDIITIRLEGQQLFVDHNGNPGPILTNNYRLGTVFTVQFVAESGRIRVYYNGGSTPRDTYSKSASGCYFKAGCYTQSNTSNGDASSAYGEVIIYDLRVSSQYIPTETSQVVPRLTTGKSKLYPLCSISPLVPGRHAAITTLSGNCDLGGRKSRWTPAARP